MSTYPFILFFLLLGKLLQHHWTVPERLPNQLNWFVISVAFPAIILLKIPELVIDTRVLFPVISPWLAIAASAGLSVGLCRYLGWSKQTEINLLILTGLGNTGFLGFPVARAFFEDELLPYALIYDQLGTFIGLTTYATMLIAIYSGGDSVDKRQVAKRILSFPPFIALILALVIPPDWLTESFTLVLELLGWTIIPLTMLSVGLQFQLRIESDLHLPVICAVVIKLLVLPTLILGCAFLLSVEKEVRDISVFMTAMPSMITGAVLLIGHNLAPRLATAILGFGTLISLVTLPIWYWFLN